ncbi:MAG: hypothetical protein HY943_18215 [Gammaproteobacteria bacterium]|nr:hypothetical protein [Gammaproteobacteria bacterium]
MSRQFTPEQLHDLTRPIEEKALEALRAGDLDTVKKLLPKMARGHEGLDALGLHAIARKVGKLRVDLGEDEARAALDKIGGELMRTWVAQFRAGDMKGAVADLMSMFRVQTGAVVEPVADTPEAFVVDLAPCGSGGRLERQGATRKYPEAYANWSDGVSSFCQLCKAAQRALNTGLGREAWTTEKGADGHCRLRFAKTAGDPAELYTAEEKAELPLTRCAKAEQKLAAGDTDIAHLLDGQRFEWMPWHDVFVCLLEYFYATALDIGGPDYLSEMLRDTYEGAFTIGFPHYAAMSDEALVTEIARTWNYHCATIKVHEEDDRFVVTLDPCGSGGRLLRGEMWRDMFHYGKTPLARFIEDPHPINFTRENAPAYCTHCAASNRAQFRGGPLFFIIDGHAQMKPGMACRQYSYKKATPRDAIDPALPRQVGMERAEPL